MRWFAGSKSRAWAHTQVLEEYRRVTLPRLTRPNLVARLYMLFTALSTAGVAWGVPGSTISRIMDSGGNTAHVVVGAMIVSTVFGFADILANDVFVLQGRLPKTGQAVRFFGWLESRRMQRCFVIGGCYMVLAMAGIGSHVTGTFWLLAYYLQMCFCAGLQAWSLRALMLATVGQGARDAVA